MELKIEQARYVAQRCLEVAEIRDFQIQQLRVESMEWRKMAGDLLKMAQRLEEKEAIPVSENL